MLTFVLSVVAWLVKLVTSKEVAAVVKVATSVYSQVPDGFLARCYALVREVATKPVDNSTRFNIVLDTLREEYPDLPGSLLRSAIENIVDVFQSGKAIG